MKYSGIVLISVLFCATALFAQKSEIKSLSTNAEIFDIDNLGYCYFVEGNKIIRTDAEFKNLSEYSDKSYGNITELDVSNPFRLLLFYKDFNAIVFLDNKLSPLRDPIMLDDLGFFSIDAVCSSSSGSFRVYDNQTGSVVTVGNDLKILQTGTNLYSITGDQKATKIRETANYVFVQLENGYILRLDKFGNYANSFFGGEGISFDCINDDVYIISNSELNGYSPINEKIFYYNFDSMPIKDFKIKGKYLYILAEKSLITFQIL